MLEEDFFLENCSLVTGLFHLSAPNGTGGTDLQPLCPRLFLGCIGYQEKSTSIVLFGNIAGKQSGEEFALYAVFEGQVKKEGAEGADQKFPLAHRAKAIFPQEQSQAFFWIVTSSAEALNSIKIRQAKLLETLDNGGSPLQRLWIWLANKDGETISQKVSCAKLVGVTSLFEDLYAFIGQWG